MSSATCAVRLSWCERTFESLPKLDAGALIGVNELSAALAIIAGGAYLEKLLSQCAQNYCKLGGGLDNGALTSASGT